MRMRNTLIVMAAAALLAGYYFFVEQPRHRRSQQLASSQSDLAAFGPSDAASVTIERPDVTLGFVRRGGRWWMTSPLADLADPRSVNQLLGVLADADIVRDLGPQEDLTPFGLADGAIAITVLTAAGDTAVALDVGNLTVDKEYAYARLAGGGVILVPTGVRRYARGEPASFRNDRLVQFQLASVVRFAVNGPDRTTTWSQGTSGDWRTERDGREIRGRQTDVEAILRRLRGLRVREFVPGAEVPIVKPFAAPPRSVTVVLEDGSSLTVRVGRRVESLVYAGAPAGDGDRIVLTDATLLDVFTPTVFDLRDRRMLRFDRADIDKIVLESTRSNVTLVRPGDEWGYPNPSMGRLDQGAVSRLVSAMSELEFNAIVDENAASAPSYGLSNPDLSLTIFGEDGAPIDRLAATRSEANPAVYVVTSSSAGAVAQMDEGELGAIVDMFENLRNP